MNIEPRWKAWLREVFKKKVAEVPRYNEFKNRETEILEDYLKILKQYMKTRKVRRRVK